MDEIVAMHGRRAVRWPSCGASFRWGSSYRPVTKVSRVNFAYSAGGTILRVYNGGRGTSVAHPFQKASKCLQDACTAVSSRVDIVINVTRS